jgi:hypothetical protein
VLILGAVLVCILGVLAWCSIIPIAGLLIFRGIVPQGAGRRTDLVVLYSSLRMRNKWGLMLFSFEYDGPLIVTQQNKKPV